MSFTDEVIEQYKKAGWSPGRNVESDYLSKPGFLQCPQFLQDFLSEYGNLIIQTEKDYPSKVKQTLELSSDSFGYFYAELEEDSFPAPKRLYPIGKWNPDSFLVACDNDGRVYLLGIVDVVLAESFEKGISKVLTDDWGDYLEFDEEKEIWIRKCTG